VEVYDLPNEIRKKVMGSRRGVMYVQFCPIMRDHEKKYLLWWIGGWSSIPANITVKPVWESKFVTAVYKDDEQTNQSSDSGIICCYTRNNCL
jgi:hypothetical protein